MREVHLAELRNSWSTWLGVAIGFVAINLTLALSALVVASGQAAVDAGLVAEQDSAGLILGQQINIGFCAVIGATVIASSTSLVIDARRGAVARLALAGATPRQVVATVMTQLAVVSVACSILGDLIACAVLSPALTFLTASREEGLATPEPVYAIGAMVNANLFAIGLALLGGCRQARRASRIAPVEALRQAATGQAQRMGVGRWIRAVLCVGLIVAAFAATPLVTAHRTKETISTLLEVSMGILVLSAALVSVVSPAVVGPLTRAWTKLVPSVDPSWDLARATTVAKGARLTKSVVPVAMTIGLLFGLVAFVDTLLASAQKAGIAVQFDQVGPLTLVSFMGEPLFIAACGGVGSLIMMSRQRDAELALAGIVGTSPRQRIAIPVMEGLIITGTGTILAMVMVTLTIGYLAVALPMVPFPFAFAPSWGVLVVCLLVMSAITTAATLLPTLPALRRAEPAVIARLVAE